MQAETLNTIYFVAALAGAAFLSRRIPMPRRLFLFAVLFLILGGSVIHEPMFDLPLAALGGNLQIKQITGYFLLACLLALLAVRRRQGSLPVPKPPFEKYWVLFLVWLGAVLLYHLQAGTVTGREARGVFEGLSSGVATYFILKRSDDRAIWRAIAKALVAVALVSTLVAVIQFFADAQFLRIGEPREMFGGRFRSSGVFSSEYMHSYYALIALMITLVFLKPGFRRVLISSVLLVGILLSFHRMSWIATAIVIALYFVLGKQWPVWKLALAGGALFLFVFVLAAGLVPVLGDVERSQLYRSRLSQDTISGRLQLYEMVFDRFDEIAFWGAGTVRSRLYYEGMVSLGEGPEWAFGRHGGIHNTYLEILFFYGLPLLLIFWMMLLSALRTFLRALGRIDHSYLFPLLFTVMYCVMNLTNSFPLNGEFGLLFGIVFGSAAAAMRTGLAPAPALISARGRRKAVIAGASA